MKAAIKNIVQAVGEEKQRVSTDGPGCENLIPLHLPAIQDALESSDVGRTTIRLIVNMLKCRNIHLIYQGESVEARVVKGCPQGGVLSLCCGVWSLTACS